MKFCKIVAVATLVSALSGCVETADYVAGSEMIIDKPLTVTGSVVYRNRSAVPPDALVSVVLADASETDIPAKILSQVTFPAAGQQVPFSFTLPYAKNRADNAKRIIVTARIELDGRLMYNTNRIYEVVTNGNVENIEVIIDPVVTQ